MPPEPGTCAALPLSLLLINASMRQSPEPILYPGELRETISISANIADARRTSMERLPRRSRVVGSSILLYCKCHAMLWERACMDNASSAHTRRSIRPFHDADEAEVVGVWHRSGLAAYTYLPTWQ